MGCGQWRRWKEVGEEGGIQGAGWLGGEEAQKGPKFAGGEQAAAGMGLLLLCRPSEVRSLENMASASGKLGGVAGVLLGVHICRERTQVWGGLPARLQDCSTAISQPTEALLRQTPLSFHYLKTKDQNKLHQSQKVTHDARNDTKVYQNG